MALKKSELLWGLGGLLVVGGFVTWLATGDDPVEDEIDRVVAALNNSRFGKGWNGVGLSVLKYELRSVVPFPLLALIDVVHSVERSGRLRGMSGRQKKAWVQQVVQESYAAA